MPAKPARTPRTQPKKAAPTPRKVTPPPSPEPPEPPEDDIDPAETLAPEEDAQPSGYTASPEDFFVRLRNYPDHSGSVLYCNRLLPVIDHVGLGGYKYKYLDRLTAPMPDGPEAFWARHGAGKLELLWNDNNKSPNRIHRTTLERSLEEAEPILSYHELIVCPENTAYLQKLVNQGKITIENNKVTANMTTSQTPGTPAATPASNGNQVESNLTNALLRNFVEQNKPLAFSDVLGIFTALKPPPQDTTLFKLLLDSADRRADAAEKRAEKLEERLMQNHAAPGAVATAAPALPLEQLATDLATLKTITGIMRGGPGAAAATAADSPVWNTVNNLVEKSGPLWEGLGRYFSVLATRSAAPPRPAQPAAAAKAAAPADGPGVARALDEAPPPAPPPSPGAAPSPTDPPPTDDGVNPNVRRLAAQVLSCIDRGIPGYSLAITLDTQAGRTTVQQIQSYGEDGIMQAIATVPEVWAKLEPIASQVREWVRDFMTFGNEPPEEGSNDATQPAA